MSSRLAAGRPDNPDQLNRASGQIPHAVGVGAGHRRDGLFIFLQSISTLDGNFGLCGLLTPNSLVAQLRQCSNSALFCGLASDRWHLIIEPQTPPFLRHQGSDGSVVEVPRRSRGNGQAPSGSSDSSPSTCRLSLSPF